LEDSTQSVVADHEKIGQLSACVGDYADFSSIVNDMTRTAKKLKSSLSFADVMEELTTKAEDLKEVQKRQVNSTMVSKSGQGGRGTGQNSGGHGGKSGRRKGLPSDVLTREEYFALTQSLIELLSFKSIGNVSAKMEVMQVQVEMESQP
jgi:hypothetical protein